MATDQKAEEKEAKPEKVSTKPEAKLVVTVYGQMVDPLTGEAYDRKPKPLDKPTGWVTSQIEAGKMAFA